MMPLDKFFLFLLFAVDAPTHPTGKDTKPAAMVSNPVKETDEPCKNLKHRHFVIQGKKKKSWVDFRRWSVPKHSFLAYPYIVNGTLVMFY